LWSGGHDFLRIARWLTAISRLKEEPGVLAVNEAGSFSSFVAPTIWDLISRLIDPNSN
jgi:hypothetical protein